MMVLRSAWPRGRKPYNRYFELLKLVNQICREHLDSLGEARP